MANEIQEAEATRLGLSVRLTKRNPDHAGKLELVYNRRGLEEAVRLIRYDPDTVMDQAAVVEEAASLRRDRDLAESVCRYFNTGGNIESARQLCEAVMANILSFNGSLPTCSVPGEGWQFLGTTPPVHDLPLRHFFYNPTATDKGKSMIAWDEQGGVKYVQMEDSSGAADK